MQSPENIQTAFPSLTEQTAQYIEGTTNELCKRRKVRKAKR